MKQKIQQLNFSYIVFSMALSFLRCGSLFFYNSERAYPNMMFIVIFAARFVFYTFIFYALCRVINVVITKVIEKDFHKNNIALWQYFMPFLLLGLVWLPLLLIRYPGAMCWDTWTMLHEYRTNELSEHQSVFYSILIGEIVSVFEHIGSANAGLFAFAIIHFLIYVFAFGYTICLIQRMNYSKLVVCSVILLYIMNPYISAYIGVMIKDAMFAGLFLIFLTTIIDIELGNVVFKRYGTFLLVILSSLLMILVRKNGIYIIALMGIINIIANVSRKNSYLLGAVLIAICVIGFVMSSLLAKINNASSGSVREGLSIPFQQTARYVTDYGEDVTEEERAIIDSVLDYNNLSDIYNPRISDPVKSTYKEDASKLLPYFRVWVHQFMRHPLCYIQATWNQFYYLFVAESDNIVLYQDIDSGWELDSYIGIPGHDIYEPIFTVPESLKTWQTWMVSEMRQLHRMPVVRMLGNVATWTYVLIYALFFTIKYRCRWINTGIPIVLAFIFIILGPAIQGHPRYMFSIIYSMPVWILYMLYQKRKRDS